LTFEPFTLQPESGELYKGDQRVELQEQPLQVLCALLDRPGRLVSRDELRRRIWPAGIYVDFDHGINNAIKRLRHSLEDTAERPRYIETLPRQGYRFIGALQRQPAKYRALAVLPFDNLRADPGQNYLADGLTEALIIMLARIGSLRVVSRTTAMLFRDVHKPLREIAAELDVDVVAAGTVLQSESRVRVTAQLIRIDAGSERHLWAQCYEKDFKDALALQWEFAKIIAHEIHLSLTAD
jgi:TolB-like protein